jgi:ceramide glucosyltransferase
MPNARGLVAFATGAAVVGSLLYTAFALERTLAFSRRRSRISLAMPSVSVLKPLHGDEPLLASKLRSFCEQDYAAYDVIFGARDAEDPALAAAREVASVTSGRARVVSADAQTPRHANPKVDTLAALVPHARGEILVFADSDMLVTPDYLGTIVAPFEDARVGAVTCLYRGRAIAATVPSRLGAMANHQQFAPSVLIAQALLGMRFGFGATIAIRRSVFDAVGGLDAIGSHLADDARLCALVVRHGRRVELASYVVENLVHEPSFGALWRHELRWARTHRALEPGGYLGLILTFPIALAFAYGFASRHRSRALGALAAAYILRFALAGAARRAFGVREREAWWLVPVRDVFGACVWLAGFGSRPVDWAGEALGIDRRGTIVT